MLKTKKTIIALSVCALMAVSVGGYVLKANAGTMTLTDKRAVFENAKKDFEQQKADFENSTLPTTVQGINERYEEGIRLKEQAKEVDTLKQEAQVPVDQVKKLENDMFIMESVLVDLMKGYDLNRSDEAAKVAKIKAQLEKIKQIRNDYKENRKSFEETKSLYEAAKNTNLN